MRSPDEIRDDISIKWLQFGALKKELYECEGAILVLQEEFEEAIYPLDWGTELVKALGTNKQ